MKTILYLSTLSLSLFLTLTSCNDDENQKQNEAPTIDAQSFNVSEELAAGDIIGIVNAIDPEEDELSFSIVTNDDADLFEISTTGILSIALGQRFEVESTTVYVIEVMVSDGELFSVAEVTITVTNVNKAPAFSDASDLDDVSEGIADDVVIGTIVASDPDGDNITFSLSSNPNSLFEINAGGEISLATGKSLDYAVATSHTIGVQITDGDLTVSADFSFDVIKITGDIPFITSWEITIANDIITIPTHPSYDYNYTITWGDDTQDDNVTGNIDHEYATAGTYTVSITGVFPAIYFNKSGDDRNKIKDVQQWGNIEWKSMVSAFRYCGLLDISATDAPDLSQVTEMDFMFDNAYALEASLNHWDVSNIAQMSYVFAGATNFNQPLDQWDVSHVTTMSNMFLSAYKFNQDISAWDVSKVTNMQYMFYNASAFSQDLSGWDTSSVIYCNTFGDNSSLTPEQAPTAGDCF
ncbi:BspA family leucine-rich repeat surface protein [Reichenbachiella sp. MSK19-1]|uniref:BspA family leucine-rich repeat surface protein n=1 Tax=Reichenbachiella sp. MSK19-1 TaxID=1897631 RepID=UPI000E6C0F93|nr:BspA family leucine-rich repeat surface protein [Reichenbachiella sp. MSK19-1]RJE75190.1 hypothetical protein BGP76_18990 [Reichenbachiella sp. MSK19-1]